ncbi:MAG: ribonuclease D [Desulfobacteraceae bacterium]|nr:ribonuclease D [Desulfobacteraceae bacterium]
MGQVKNRKQEQLPDYEVITTEQDLTEFVQKTAKAQIAAIDLESDSMYHYREKVCLIQMAVNGYNVVIDPLLVKDLSALKPIFEDPATCKVLHGSDYDIRSLYRDYGISVNNLFDTQLASMYLGYKETGLESVVAHHFGIELNKKYQKKDWSQRPLPDEMITYAALDVVYLIPLAKMLIKKLKTKKRLVWVQEECERLSKVRPNDCGNDPRFLKVKGAGRLGANQLAVLEALLKMREEIACHKDRPLFKIIGNMTLLKIATAMPGGLRSLEKSNCLSEKQMVMYAKPILQTVKQARLLPKEELPRYPRTKAPRLSPKVPLRVQTLKTWRDKQAQKMDLDPALLFNKALIRNIAIAKPLTLEEFCKIPGIHQWQVNSFGKQVLKILKTSS